MEHISTCPDVKLTITLSLQINAQNMIFWICTIEQIYLMDMQVSNRNIK